MISNLSKPISTRRQLAIDALWCCFHAFLTKVKPNNYKEAIMEFSWIKAMQEEIHEFEQLEVWKLVPIPSNVMLINLKWIFKVKLDKYSRVLKNKARLVAKGAVDPTLFTWKEGEHRILVQIYVHNIIFASTNPSFYNKFADQMSKCFKMSMMRQIYFFLGLQISQNPRGIFINQSKYALEMLKKYGLDQCDPVDMLADIFTKALARECFEFLVKRLCMQSLTPEELKHLAESDEDEE
ncbi:retrovirus-related pol polyprotein from transposon TNT 1-94 [Tanacetum coccineum]